ncbi:MAG: nucleotidyltransferase domain-containing protein [Candidatus Desantisbacteria bacterium]
MSVPTDIRIDAQEKEALRFALDDFKGMIYLFGSRLDNIKKGGDIDILLIPQKKMNPLKLSIKVQTNFFSKCEENIDVVVYDKKSVFCQEILKNAKRIDLARI